MKPIPVITLIAAGLVTAAAQDEPALDYYLDLQFTGGGGSVTVNGFPLFQSGLTGTGYSTWLTPYLQEGENEIAVRFRSLPSKPNPRIEFKVVSHPHDGKQRNPALARALIQAEKTPRGELWLTELPSESLEILAGARREEGGLSFEPQEDGRVMLGARVLDPTLELRGTPLRLDTVSLTSALTEVEVHFLSMETGAQLTFEGLSVQPGVAEVALPVENIKHGLEYIGDTSFDTVWISGTPLNAIEGAPVSVQSLKLHALEETVEINETFTVNTLQTWNWESGANVREALNDEARREALVKRLAEIHATMVSKPTSDWLPLFTNKTRTYASANYTELEAMEKSQKQFFDQLVATPNWGLEPFQPDRLQIFAVNDHVVRVRYADREGPLISTPMLKPNARRPNRFTIPLYLSLIDGKWEIVL